MRISLWVPNLIVPLETYMITQIRDLCDQGHELRIIAFGRLKGIPPYRDENYPVFEQALNIAPPTNDLKKARAMLMGFFKSRHKKKLLNSLNGKRFGRLTHKFYLSWYLMALEAHDSFGEDLILCHFGHIGNVAAGLHRLGCLKTRFATFFHGFDFHRLVPRYGAAFYKLLRESGFPVFAASRHLKNGLRDIGFPEETTFVHNMALNPLFFNPPPPEDKHLRPRPLKLITVARLERIKGLHLAIRALALLHKEGVAFEYTIIGDGAEKGALESLTRQEGLSGSVRFFGALSSPEIKEHLDRSHLFLLPSIIDEGGNPLVLQEALARGLLAIGSRRGGIPELIGKCGWLMDDETPGALLKAIKAYLGTPAEERARRQRDGQRKIRESFDIRALNRDLLRICLRFPA